MISNQKPSAWLLTLEKKVPRICTPQGVMLALMAMYVLKVIVKVGIGGFLAESIIIGSDGAHNISDIVEAGVVMLVVSLASGVRDSEDPFGKRNLETILVIVIGCMLGFIGISVFCASGIGIIQTWTPNIFSNQFFTFIPLFLLPEVRTNEAILHGWYPTLAIVTIGSIALSFMASKIQIFVGSKYGKSSIIADGIETRSDGIVESITLIGISGEYFFRNPSIEYYFGILAGGFILHIAYKLGSHGIGVILQKSLPTDLKRAVHNSVEAMHGVIRVEDLKMFPIGSAAVVVMKITTPCSIEMGALIKKIATEKITQILEEAGFPECGCYIRMAPPEKNAHRVAYLMTNRNGVICICSYPHEVTHIRVVDMEYEKPVRVRDYPAPANLSPFLHEKRVTRTYMRFQHQSGSAIMRGIRMTRTTIADPKELGIA